MKPDKYKEIITKLDTDKDMDQRIKNKLIYSDYADGSQDKKYARPYDKRDRKSHFQPFTKITVLRPVFSSLVFIIFIAAVIYGIIKNMPDDTADPSSEVGGSPAVSEYTDKTSGTKISDAEVADTLQNAGAADSADLSMSEDPEDIIAEASADTVAEKSADIAAETPADIITQAPAGEEAQVPAAETTLSPTDEPAVMPMEESVVKQGQGSLTDTNTGGFYFASFDVLTRDNVKASIPNLIVRLHGDVNTINPADLTDLVLTRDGVTVENNITLTDRVEHFVWNYENISDFYFKFDNENKQPGKYSMTGKYKGVPFTVYNKILEGSVTGEAADPDALRSVGWAYYPAEDGTPEKVSELVFIFNGVQNSFYQSDLTDLKLTVDSQEIPFAFTEQVFRYLEANADDSSYTSFNLILCNEMTQPGTYLITGCYKGVAFTSDEITIP